MLTENGIEGVSYDWHGFGYLLLGALDQAYYGEKSLDDWDSYMKDLQELGLDELISIQQARCDRAFK